MKKILPLILLAVFFGSCSNDFEINAPYEDTSIVYGLLNQSDTAHYIKIERGFISENTSAFEIAQRADSLYYDNISPVIHEIDPNTSQTVNTFDLIRVDGNLEGYIKDTGTIANTPNYIYKFKDQLDNSKEYKLEFTNNSDIKIEATTKLIPEIEITLPTIVNREYDFSNPNFPRPIANFKVPENAALISITLELNYSETHVNTGVTEVKTIKEVIVSNYFPQEPVGGTERFSLSQDEFFKMFTANMDINSLLERNFSPSPLDLVIAIGGEDLARYTESNFANLSLTSTQPVPLVSNIENGYGVFSTRSVQKFKQIRISTQTKIAIQDHPILSQLNLNF